MKESIEDNHHFVIVISLTLIQKYSCGCVHCTYFCEEDDGEDVHDSMQKESRLEIGPYAWLPFIFYYFSKGWIFQFLSFHSLSALSTSLLVLTFFFYCIGMITLIFTQ